MRSEFLPLTAEECVARCWLPRAGEPLDRARHGVDFVFVSGDAYVDHPSFAVAMIPRLLEHKGFRVAILAQPPWQDASAFRAFGKPRIAWLVSAGNLDSMLDNYTAHKRPRSDDSYAPGGEGGLRPDYATVVYAQRCREAHKDVPLIIGGVEASMRRLAHYDYWSDQVRRSIVLDARADLLVYGMGERPLLEVVERLVRGERIEKIRDVAGTAYAVGRKTLPHFTDAADHSDERPWWTRPPPARVAALPSYDELRGDDVDSKRRFAFAQGIFHREQNPDSSPILYQRHGDFTVVVNPPQQPLSTAELDALWELPFVRAPHPRYGDRAIPAFEMVKASITIMRGCFGGCTFCAITEHQGKRIQSRSEASVLREVRELARAPGFSGVLSDLGGPTANMYRMRCTSPAAERVCRRPSCVQPTLCAQLDTNQAPLVQLLRKVRAAPRVKKVLVASGVRMDLAVRDPHYLDELAAHHVGGHLKVAPEHVDAATLRLMKKPGIDVYLQFAERFAQASERAGKEQYLVPYFVSSHPGCDVDGAIELALFLKQHRLRPQQVQDFIPTPSTPATCMWWTGLDPATMKPVFAEKKQRGKRKQKALLQYWLPDNAPLVREALREAGRADLIGHGAQALVAGWDRVEADRGPRRKRRR
ncbi:MAG: YgiQ family radical SAM protein [Deltaproteobacteria bacterium]|nr:YgiQ family radical SAM protein [Deltaproteobacteria bacterium]